MDACSNLEVKGRRRFGYRKRAAHGFPRAVEGGQESVAGGDDLSPLESGELAAHQLIVLVEQVAPGAVADFGGDAGRIHDVREYQRRQNALEFGTGVRSSQELLDFLDNPIAVSAERESVGPRKFDKLGARNEIRDLSAQRNRHDPVLCPVDDQGWGLDRRQDGPNIRQHGLAVVVADGAGSERGSLKPRNLRREAFITHAARCEPFQTSTALEQSVGHQLDGLLDKFERIADGMVGRGRLHCGRCVKRHGAAAVWVRRREQHRHEVAI